MARDRERLSLPGSAASPRPSPAPARTASARRRASAAGRGAGRGRARAARRRALSRPRPTAQGRLDGARRPACSRGIGELDRVLGGGVVRGSLVLIGGDPGIGKSRCCCRRRGRWREAAAAGPLRVGRGVGGPGQAARRPARPRRRRLCSVAGERPGGRAGGVDHDQAARAGRGLDPDGVPARARIGAGQRGPGARVRRAPDGAGQGAGHRHLPGRPRHQGRRARRARACSSTSSTPCSTSRASSTTPIACCAR